MLEIVTEFDRFFWGYIGFSLVLTLGLYLTFKTRCFQLRVLPESIRLFFTLMKERSTGTGIHPLRAFFASVGGMVGVGNIVGIVSAVQIGGPGALLWVWIAGFFGALIKYSEIFLGFKYRQPNARGGFDGGPMFFLPKAFPRAGKWLARFAAFLLCIYGVEVYQFSVLTQTLELNWHFDRMWIVMSALALILYASVGGVPRVSKICSSLSPFFMLAYIGMALWIVLSHATFLPYLLKSVFTSAFTGHAATGGFIGSSLLLAIQQGTARAAYSADLGIGYDSIIHSESAASHPANQARLGLLGVCLDNFVCTLSLLLALVSHLWFAEIPASLIVQTALSTTFPGMSLFVPLFLLVLAYCTMIAYFTVGIKCAQFLSPKWGKPVYLIYGASAFFFFSFFDPTIALLVMSLCGSFLLSTHTIALFRLRHQISFPCETLPTAAHSPIKKPLVSSETTESA